MKAKVFVVWLVGSLGLIQAQAQNVVVAAGVTVTPATVQTAVEPVAPVVQVRPAVWGAPLAYPVPLSCGARYPYLGYTPNVIYFGGPYSHLRNYYSGNAAYCYPYGPVVCFGRGEAWERGYHFNWRR